MNYFNANGTYPNGKYQFNDFATINICNVFNNVGACISGINYNFKKGDVIDVTNQSFNDIIQEWQAQLPIPEQIRTVPFSILTKVDDSTPVTTTFEKSTYTTNPQDYQPIYDYNKPNTEVTCSDGTKDVANGDILPCQGHGGVKTDAPPVKPLLTQTQKKWLAVIGITALAYVILYKAGSLD